MRQHYPASANRLHFMGTLDRRGPLFIEDPYGSDPSAFERAYRAIATALREGSRHPGRLRPSIRQGPEPGSGPAVDVAANRDSEQRGPANGSVKGRVMAVSKRERLADLCRRLGLLRISECLIKQPGLLVLNYHRLGSSAGNAFDEDLFSADPDVFRAQLLYLRKHFEVIGLDEVLRMVEGRSALDRPSVLITFDDGYADNFDLGLPILQDLGLPAAFFIPTELIQSSRLSWWDHIAYSVKHTHQETLTIDYPVPLTLDLRPEKRADAIRRIQVAYKRADRLDVPAFFDQLDGRLDVRVNPQSLGRGLFMSWEQIRALRRAGMGVGAHTHSRLARSPRILRRRRYDTDGSGEAQDYLGSLDLTTDSRGQAMFAVPFAPPPGLPIITATATDDEGNTSELSALRQGLLDVPAGFVRVFPDQPTIFSASLGDALTWQDPEAGPLAPSWDTTLSVATGTLTLSGTDGLTGSGNGTGTLEYSGGLAALNAALEGLRDSPPPGFHGRSTLTLTAQSAGAAPIYGQVTLTDGIFSVTNTADGGDGSFRQAILDADPRPGPSPSNSPSPARASRRSRSSRPCLGSTPRRRWTASPSRALPARRSSSWTEAGPVRPMG